MDGGPYNCAAYLIAMAWHCFHGLRIFTDDVYFAWYKLEIHLIKILGASIFQESWSLGQFGENWSTPFRS